MLIEILDPTMDGTLKIISPEGESCGVINFDIQYQALGYNELVTISISFEAYTNILGEKLDNANI